MAEANEARGLEYLILGHVTVDRLDDKRVALGGTATYAALTARNMGARVGVHTSASYEPGLIDTLSGALVARVPAEYTTCFVNDYSSGKRVQTINPPGSEVGPGQTATWGRSSDAQGEGFGFRWTAQDWSSKHIPFDWTGPG